MTPARFAASWLLVGFLGLAGIGRAQAQVPAPEVPTMPAVALDSVAVAPQAVDTQGWLLLDADIQTELEGAVHNLYDFQFERADKQFRSLRRRYPQHPLAYFLLALSTWWKMVPLPVEDTRYDRIYFAYLDSAQTKAQALLAADPRNYEACFFLSATYGFEARAHADRHHWRQATVASRRALDYLQKSRGANGLSSEFELGFGLFDYYAVWIGQEYPWLRPILFFFPKGDSRRGIAELWHVSKTAFYAKTEADFFLVQILGSPREQQPALALGVAQRLAHDFPGNSRFQVDYARLCFAQGQWAELEATCQAVLTQHAQGRVGYEALAGRPCAYFLGYLAQHRDQDPDRAQDYYQRCVVFSETLGRTTGYYLFAQAALGRLAVQRRDGAAAHRAYAAVLAHADRREPAYAEAQAYLRAHRTQP
ncbi:hypothetical protein A0257_22720 (plasmid) [Hymenobacter psoromatis]|nr:hypothetical protein A0257_22720 [Hymenobacter psoromatis]